jgi:hypothetical protein
VNAVIWILFGFMFLSGVLAGLLALLAAGIRSDDRRRNIHLAPCTHAQSVSRRLLVTIRKPGPDCRNSEEE